mmetsp:Transcript_58778/g.108507  ORF Transcript_58778/g.108507 Transcript_58778/m.108507 type:complete len:394 (+) Transcript_58778:108-1289(+)
MATSARHYRIGNRRVTEVQHLARGRFGNIVLARDSYGELFALKKSTCPNERILSLAAREADVWARLPVHPNIARYYGHSIAEKGNGVYEVVVLMELCDGGHIFDHLDLSGSTLKESEVLDILGQVAEGLQALHSLSTPIMHRDVKAENVLFGRDRRWKLCDFGSASIRKISAEDREFKTLGADLDGLPSLMHLPPELLDITSQAEISEKVDIWMLGCLLYTLMYRLHPFARCANRAIVEEEIHIPQEPKFSSHMKGLLLWMLTKDPGGRPCASDLCKAHSRRAVTDFLPQAVQDRMRQEKVLAAKEGGVISLDQPGTDKVSRPKAVALRPLLGPSPVNLPLGYEANYLPTNAADDERPLSEHSPDAKEQGNEVCWANWYGCAPVCTSAGLHPL